MTVRCLSLFLSVSVSGLLASFGSAQVPRPDLGAGCPTDAVGCHRADVEFEHRDSLFDDRTLDSGWIPAGAPLQVRFLLFFGGSTEVDIGGTVVTAWPSALDVSVPGRPNTGRFSMNYGLEVVVRIRFDITIGRVNYAWAGELPIRGRLPGDLRIVDQRTFDPFALAPDEPIQLEDATGRVKVLQLDLTDAIIPVPGIAGGIALDSSLSVEASYQTDRIEVSDALGPIEVDARSTTVRPDPGVPEFGPAKDLTILPHGTIHYEGVIHLHPTLYIEIAGRRIDLASLDVPFTTTHLARGTKFEPAEVHVPLPDIRVEPTLSFGEVPVGSLVEQLLLVQNEGEADLVVSVRPPVAPLSVDAPELVIPPGSSEPLAVRFEPLAPDRMSGVLLFETNDPDEPLVTVRMDGIGVGWAEAGDAGLGGRGPAAAMAGGCSCRTASSPARGPRKWPLVPLGILGWLCLTRRGSRGRGVAVARP